MTNFVSRVERLDGDLFNLACERTSHLHVLHHRYRQLKRTSETGPL
jgi:hypothetical protein